MRSCSVDGEPRLFLWQRVREFAVPPSMIQSATGRRAVGDWAGACVAARFDADLDLRAVTRAHGHQLAARLRDDLRHLAPDLLRWHFPRVAPDGLLRPGLTVSLARYRPRLHLVARTAPGWADAGQRISLTLWDGTHRGGAHPHPHPDRRFRLDLHRHLWDARHAAELRDRSGAEAWPGEPAQPPLPTGAHLPQQVEGLAVQRWPAGAHLPQQVEGLAAHRWPAEAALLRQAEGRADEPVIVRAGARLWLTATAVPEVVTGPAAGRPVLPDAATWVPPDVALLRAGLVDPGRLHPLVAAALVPGHPPAEPLAPGDALRTVDCRGDRHRIGLVDGMLAPLDHGPEELRREEMLVAFGGPPLPCLRAVDEANRRPESLGEVRARLDHGDVAGALAAVEELLGPEVLLRGGALRDELESAVALKVLHGLYRNGMTPVRGPYKKLPSREKVIY